MRFRLRAAQRLFLSYLVLIAGVVLLMSFGADSLLRRHLRATVEDDLRRELLLARSLYASAEDRAPDAVADRIGALSGRRVTVIRPGGEVVGESAPEAGPLAGIESHIARPEVRAALRGEFGAAVRVSETVGTEHLYLAVRAPDGNVIRLAVPLGEVEATLSRVQRGIFSIGGGAVAVALLFSLGFSIAVTRPLRHIHRIARELAAGDLSRRVRYARDDELGDLGRTLNQLAQELQRRLGQLEVERAEMQALIDTMSEGVVALGPDGTVSRVNPAARRIFSLPPDPRGLPPAEVARRGPFLDLVRAVLQGRAVRPTEFLHGDLRLLATGHPLEEGGAVLVFLDISELRRLEDARRDFVANASHELKTPLTAIRGFTETLLDEELPPELRRRFTRTVHDNAERLQRIIDDLLDLSRIESGGWRVQPEPLRLGEVIEDALGTFADQAQEKGIDLQVDLAPACERVLADPSGLRQILVNLVGNALRYTPTGGRVRVLSRCLAGGAWVELAVADTGSGIPAAHLPRIFERFYRIDTGRGRGEGGTGLGLAIVRHLVERHGGRVEAESELGRGTTVRFTLPAAPT